MDTLKFLFSLTASILTYLLGGFDDLIIAMFIFIVTDYITGMIKAYRLKKLSSEVGFKGILKKTLYLFVVVICVELDNLLLQNQILRNAGIYFIIANEGLSILENLAEMNVPLPSFIKTALEVIEHQSEIKDIKNK